MDLFLRTKIMILSTIINYLGRKLQVKTTKGIPDINSAPNWANYMAQVESGAWFWLAKKGVPQRDDSNEYWPDSGRFKFTGFVSEKNPNWQETIQPVR